MEGGGSLYTPVGAKEVSDILAVSSKFIVYYDPDIDGIISGYLMQRFLSFFGHSSSYYINENREHGFKMPKTLVDNLKGQTVICVDFAVTQQELEWLTDEGVNVIVIDHHNITSESLVALTSVKTGCRGVIVNNQYSFEPAEYRFLSGAGVVYYLLKVLCSDFCQEDEKSLVGISLLTDARPIEGDIAREFLLSVYNNESTMMSYLLAVTKPDRDYGFGVQRALDRNYLDYTFAPKINSLLRLNRGDAAVQIINGTYPLVNDLETLRRVQSSVVDAILANLQGHELGNLVVKYVLSDINTSVEVNISNFIGVACSRVKNGGKTSFLFVRDGIRLVRGSVRGLHDGVDYLGIFRSFGLKCEGHKAAFGVLTADILDLDIVGLDEAIEQAERGIKAVSYEGRILDVSNLGLFLQGKNKQIAVYNTLVRDAVRVYVRYTGSNVKRVQKGRMWEFIIDGVTIKCFDEDLSLDNALILPLYERNSYTQFYLRKKI